MNDDESTTGDDVLIGRGHWDVPVCVEVRAYLHFGYRIDCQLRHLVKRWAHLASPQARQAAADFQAANGERQRH